MRQSASYLSHDRSSGIYRYDIIKPVFTVSPVSDKHPIQNHLPRGFDGFSMFTKFKTLILLDQFLWRPGHFLELTLFDPPYFRTNVKF